MPFWAQTALQENFILIYNSKPFSSVSDDTIFLWSNKIISNTTRTGEQRNMSYHDEPQNIDKTEP